MIARRSGGKIINISTINTERTSVGMAPYDASKGGLNALTKAAALESAPFGITVNAVALGGVRSPGSLPVHQHFGRPMGVEAVDMEFAKRLPWGG